MKTRPLYRIVIGIWLSCLVFTDCGKMPISLPLPYTGNLHISAEASDNSDIDSIYVELDDQDFGKHANPHFMTDVIIGTHKLRVKHDNTAPKTQTVEIIRDETTRATFELTLQGPYVGREAPTFSGQNLEGNSFDLLEHRGKVVLLAFFEHTWTYCIDSELPDIRDIIRSQFTYNQLTVVGICYTASSAVELRDIVSPIGDTFPFIFDERSSIFNTYEVFGIPSYFIIDQEGNVQYRLDAEYNRIDEMKAKIEELLSKS